VSAASLTLAQAYGARDSAMTRVAGIVAGAALIALCAQVSIPLGFTPVPLTGQTFAVLVVGASLGGLDGAASAILYVLVGALGAPVYAGHSHGWHVLSSASGGYLVGFIAAAALTGFLAQNGWDRQVGSSLGALVTGNVLIYAFGVAWLAHVLHVGTATALTDGVYPFIPGDLIKVYLAAGALPFAWRLRGRV
jgi:biotin transport system substrate-specific component